MLEDNVRAPVECCADLVTKAKEASEMLHAEKGIECHFRFIGWLGSLTNLEYLLQTHSRKRAYPPREKDAKESGPTAEVFPFPLYSHLKVDLDELGITDSDAEGEGECGGADEQEASDDKTGGTKHSKPGGNFM